MIASDSQTSLAGGSGGGGGGRIITQNPDLLSLLTERTRETMEEATSRQNEYDELQKIYVDSPALEEDDDDKYRYVSTNVEDFDEDHLKAFMMDKEGLDQLVEDTKPNNADLQGSQPGPQSTAGEQRQESAVRKRSNLGRDTPHPFDNLVQDGDEDDDDEQLRLEEEYQAELKRRLAAENDQNEQFEIPKLDLEDEEDNPRDSLDPSLGLQGGGKIHEISVRDSLELEEIQRAKDQERLRNIMQDVDPQGFNVLMEGNLTKPSEQKNPYKIDLNELGQSPGPPQREIPNPPAANQGGQQFNQMDDPRLRQMFQNPASTPQQVAPPQHEGSPYYRPPQQVAPYHQSRQADHRSPSTYQEIHAGPIQQQQQPPYQPPVPSTTYRLHEEQPPPPNEQWPPYQGPPDSNQPYYHPQPTYSNQPHGYDPRYDPQAAGYNPQLYQAPGPVGNQQYYQPGPYQQPYQQHPPLPPPAHGFQNHPDPQQYYGNQEGPDNSQTQQQQGSYVRDFDEESGQTSPPLEKPQKEKPKIDFLARNKKDFSKTAPQAKGSYVAAYSQRKKVKENIPPAPAMGTKRGPVRAKHPPQLKNESSGTFIVEDSKPGTAETLWSKRSQSLAAARGKDRSSGGKKNKKGSLQRYPSESRVDEIKSVQSAPAKLQPIKGSPRQAFTEPIRSEVVLDPNSGTRPVTHTVFTDDGQRVSVDINLKLVSPTVPYGPPGQHYQGGYIMPQPNQQLPAPLPPPPHHHHHHQPQQGYGPSRHDQQWDGYHYQQPPPTLPPPLPAPHQESRRLGPPRQQPRRPSSDNQPSPTSEEGKGPPRQQPRRPSSDNQPSPTSEEVKPRHALVTSAVYSSSRRMATSSTAEGLASCQQAVKCRTVVAPRAGPVVPSHQEQFDQQSVASSPPDNYDPYGAPPNAYADRSTPQSQRSVGPSGKAPSPMGSPYRVLPPISPSGSSQRETAREDSSYQPDSGRRTKPLRRPQGPPRPKEEVLPPKDNTSYLEQMRRAKERKPVEFKQYTVEDYKKLKREVRLGGLGPDLDSEDLKDRREKRERQTEYANQVKLKNQKELLNAPRRPTKAERMAEQAAVDDDLHDRRRIALEYAKSVPKPKVRDPNDHPSESNQPVKSLAVPQVQRPPGNKRQPDLPDDDLLDLASLRKRHEEEKEKAALIRQRIEAGQV